jgi:hypothetical protein
MRLVLFWGMLLSLLTAVRAEGAEIACGPVEAGVIALDGLLDDWAEVSGVDAGGRDPNLSFTVKCNLGPRSLYLLVDVRDDYFARTKQSRPGEDHVELTLGGRKLLVYPGDQAKVHDRVLWGKKPARGVRSFGALQPKGWAVELELPLGEVGVHPGTPRIPFSARVDDCDSKVRLKTDRSLELSGAIAFADAEGALDAFLRDQHLSRGAIYLDKMISTGRGQKARVLLAGRFMVVITDGYTFVELPFKDRRELREARVVDLAGDGREAIVLRYRESGGGGARELLTAYRPDGAEQIARIFSHEVGKFAGSSSVQDKVSFVRRGHATDLVVEAGAASGFTQASWREAPSSDAIPILLPWADDRKARYQFSGDEYKQVP